LVSRSHDRGTGKPAAPEGNESPERISHPSL
jgi:hypothetical protein